MSTTGGIPADSARGHGQAERNPAGMASDLGADSGGALDIRDALQRLASSKLTGPLAGRPHRSPSDDARDAAVLMLFGKGTMPRTDAGRSLLPKLEHAGMADIDVLLLQRAATLRHHAGQVAFPGGAVDAEDTDVTAAALREAEEETGLAPDGVEVLGQLTPIFLPPSKFLVTPVVAWSPTQSPVRVMDHGESASVYRVPVADLLAAPNRGSYVHPSGYHGPAFDVGVLTVWGFTAGLLDFAFDQLSWALPWDSNRLIELR
ncbi:CoA pyrophosphatase [Saxibacter everestensis]|uniref:CoA pyrophosphatase n=1 Tax=Saxibacter everestensis TaxID=2909229 RepID=A0ABY8QQ17_9MICO|nr:CoA pyrophosphatase [Brevibacteriaceae bacterium ZFBP1038]